MTSLSLAVGQSLPAHVFACRLLCWCVLALAPCVSYADVSVYAAVVPMKGTTEADRANAFGAALQAAVVRASGRREAATAPKVLEAAAAPMSLVQQYSTTPDRMLKVGFDGRAIEQLLQQAGLPLWPEERPTTTVLLFNGNASRAMTVSEQTPERVALEQAALTRGIALAWPGENVDPGAARSRLAAGATTATLVGVAAGNGFQWSFGHAGQVVQAQGSLTDGIDLAADTLAARYAPASTRSVNTVAVRIGGLANLQSYAALTRYLEDLSLVRSVSVREFANDSVAFELGVRGDLDLLQKIFALDARVVPAARAATGEGLPAAQAEFLWRP
jgi:hypothetical protein